MEYLGTVVAAGIHYGACDIMYPQGLNFLDLFQFGTLGMVCALDIGTLDNAATAGASQWAQSLGFLPTHEWFWFRSM